MAPVASFHEVMAGLQRRYYCDSYGYCYGNRSGWHGWGRWVFLGLVILFFFLIFLLLCVRSRKRRQQGNPPMYGTGWMGNWGQGQNYPPPQYSQQPPVGAQYTGTTYNSNQGYYGNNDVPLQQPSHAYQPTRGAGDDYAPPAGPPPGKK